MSDPVPSSSKESLEQAGASDESIQRVHSILLREKPEPREGYSPMPLFLLGLMSALIFVCCVYIVHYRGGFDPLVYDERFDPATMGAAKAGPKELTPEQVIAAGKRLYTTCATCHNPAGTGTPGIYPPLAGAEWVTGSEERLIRILLHGLNGPITVKGVTYSAAAMPAFGQVPGGGYNWSDDKIAQVLTYIRSDWGNQASPITAAQVTAVRTGSAAGRSATKPWTEAELKEVP